MPISPAIESTTSPGPPRAQLRVAGTAVLVGIVLISIDNTVLGNPPRDEPITVLEYIHGRPWFATRVIGLLGMVSWLAAFTIASGALRDHRARLASRLSRAVLTVCVSVFAVQYAHDGFGLGTLAEDYAAGDVARAVAVERAEVMNLMIGGASMVAQLLLGLALMLYAIATLFSADHSRVLGWFGVISCAGWFLSAAAQLMQLPGMSFEVILPFAGLGTVWAACLAVGMFRRSAKSSASSVS